MTSSYFFIMIMLINIAIIVNISTNHNKVECNECPTTWDYIRGISEHRFVNSENTKECIESFPEGYYHTMTQKGICRITFWSSDLE